MPARWRWMMPSAATVPPRAARRWRRNSAALRTARRRPTSRYPLPALPHLHSRRRRRCRGCGPKTRQRRALPLRRQPTPRPHSVRLRRANARQRSTPSRRASLHAWPSVRGRVRLRHHCPCRRLRPRRSHPRRQARRRASRSRVGGGVRRSAPCAAVSRQRSGSMRASASDRLSPPPRARWRALPMSISLASRGGSACRMAPISFGVK